MLGDIDKNLKPIKPQIHLCLPNLTAIAKLSNAYSKDHETTLADINEIELTIPYKVQNRKREWVRNKNIDLIRDRYLLKVALGEKVEYYVITKITDDSDDKGDVKTIKAYSLGYLLRDKQIRYYNVVSYNPKMLITDALRETNWSLGENLMNDSFSLNKKYRSFDIGKSTILDFIIQVAKEFDAIIVWDTINKVVDFEVLENVQRNQGLRFSMKKYLKSISKETDGDEMVTRFYPYGSEGLTIHSENPTGSGYLEDFSFFLHPFKRDINKKTIQSSYYMSDELCHAILDYKEIVDDNKETYSQLLELLRSKQSELTDYKNDLYDLETEKAKIEDIIDIQNSAETFHSQDLIYDGQYNPENIEIKEHNMYFVYAKANRNASLQVVGDSYVDMTADKWTAIAKVDNKSLLRFKLSSTPIETEINIEVAEISEDEFNDSTNSELVNKYSLGNKQQEIDSIQTFVDSIEVEIEDVEYEIENLQETLKVENNFTPELINERNDYIIAKDWTNDSITNAEVLMVEAEKEFKKVREPQLVVNIDIVNFLEIVEAQRDWKKLRLGDLVTIVNEYTGINVSAMITAISYDYENGSIKLKIANVTEIKDSEKKFFDSLYGAISTSTTVNMNKYKWDKVLDYTDKVDGLITGEWNAVKQKIIAGTNESVEISRRGILVTNPDDPNSYLVINHGVLAITKSNGKVWEHAITTDGIIGERIIGKILAGESLVIENMGGTFKVDGQGATLIGTSLNIIGADGSQSNFNDIISQTKQDAIDYADVIKQDVDGELSDLTSALNATDEYIDGSFKDGIVDASEKLAIAEHLKQLESEKKDVDQRYQTVYANSYLFNDQEINSNAKSDLYTAYQNYQTNYTGLVNAITVAIQDSSVIEAERVNVESKFNSYGVSIGDLSDALENAIDNITQHKTEEAKSYAKGLKDDIDIEIGDINEELSGTQQYIDGSFYDGIIEESEAKAIEKHLNYLSSEKADIDNKYSDIVANGFLRSVQTKAQLNTAKDDFNTAHNNLINSINSAISDGKTSEVEKSNVDSKFSNYRYSVATLSTAFEKAIDDIASNKASDAESNAKTHADDIKTNLVSQIGDVDRKLDGLDEYVDGSFKDGVIEESEAKSIEKYINSLDTEKDDLDSRFTSIYTNSYLNTTLVKSELNNSKQAYDDAHTALINSINTAIADGKTTTGEKNDVDSKFGNYKSSLSRFSTAMEEAIDDIATEKAKEAESNANAHSNGIKNDLQGQINGVTNSLDGLDEYVDGSFKDGIIEETEAKSIEKYINSLNVEKADLDNRHSSIYNNDYLKSSTVKTTLYNAKVDFNNKHSSLITAINSAISDGKTNDTEKNNVDSKFGSYKTSLSNLSKALEDAIDNIATEKAKEVEEYVTATKNDLQGKFNDVSGDLSSLDEYVDGSFKDGIIEEGEAQSIEKYINALESEKGALDNKYNNIYSNSYLKNSSVKSSLSIAKSNYNSSHNNLVTAINSAISNGKTTIAEKNNVDSKFDSYKVTLKALYTALENGVDDIASNKASEAQTNAQSYADGLKEALDSDIGDVSRDLSDLSGYVDGSFKDGIIEVSEAKAIEKYLNSLGSEKSDLDSRYTPIYNNSYLKSGTIKSNLSSKKSSFNSAHSNLVSAINSAISDGKTTVAEKNNVDSKFDSYKNALAQLADAFEDAVDNIADNRAKEAESNAKTYASKGNLYARGTGYNRVANRILGVNDNEVYNTTGRGLRLTAINRSTLNVSFDQTYDVYNGDTEQDSLATKLNSLDDSVIIVLTSWDAIATNATLQNAMERCGGTGKAFGGSYHRIPYVLVGIPNIGKGAGLEMYTSDAEDAPRAEISTKIIDGIPQGIDVTRRALWEDAKADAKNAQDDADIANGKLEDMANDSKITPTEKKSVLKEWDVIVSERASLVAQASAFSVSSSTYSSSYSSLSSYISPILSNMNANSGVDGNQFRAKFKSYYDARTDLLNSVSDKAKTLADSAQNTADNAWEKFSGSGNTLPKGNVEFNFADSGSKGGNAKNTDNVGNQSASVVQNSTINFNGRNDRISTTPRSPVILTNGTAIDHTTNTDGSVDISFEWTFSDSGDAGNIDGFIVFVYSTKSTSSAYSFGTSVNSESAYYVTPEREQ